MDKGNPPVLVRVHHFDPGGELPCIQGLTVDQIQIEGLWKGPRVVHVGGQQCYPRIGHVGGVVENRTDGVVGVGSNLQVVVRLDEGEGDEVGAGGEQVDKGQDDLRSREGGQNGHHRKMHRPHQGLCLHFAIF